MKLQICFDNEKEYQKAVEFVNKFSTFYAESDDEWKMLVVECSDQDDANVNEQEIDAELNRSEFQDYHFEIEY